MKKTLSLILALIMIFGVLSTAVGCSEESSDNTDDTQNNEAPEEESINITSIAIGGVDISQYKIVYAAPDSTLRKLKNSLTTEYEFDKLTAVHLMQQIYVYTGVQLDVAVDSSEETEYEILVGDTKRAESDTYADLKTHKYAVAVSGTKLLINGGEYGNTYHAVDYLINALAESADESGAASLAADFELKGDHHLTTIACIGDSITAGVGSSSASVHSWPAVLGRILWRDCVVYNYGNSGKTMRNDLADKYKGTNEYTTALRNAKDTDITLIMLGTNDSNRDQSWTDADDVLYNDSCRELVDLLKDKNGDMKFYLMTCPVYQGNDNFGSAHIRQLQEALVEDLSAEGYDMNLYDMYKLTSKTVTIRRFPDGLHPNDEGHAMMADGVAEMLAPVLYPEENTEG